MNNSSYLALVEKIALECGYHMRNGDITHEQYEGAMMEAVPFLWPALPNQKVNHGNGYNMFFGLPVVPTIAGYKLFVRCDYCGVRQPPTKQDGGSVCAKCGASIE